MSVNFGNVEFMGKQWFTNYYDFSAVAKNRSGLVVEVVERASPKMPLSSACHYFAMIHTGEEVELVTDADGVETFGFNIRLEKVNGRSRLHTIARKCMAQGLQMVAIVEQRIGWEKTWSFDDVLGPLPPVYKETIITQNRIFRKSV